MSLVCAEDNATASLEEVNIDAKDISMHYKNGERLSAELLDLNDTPLPDCNLTFNINDQNYTRTTGNDGKASIAINLIPGTYLANIYFLGNSQFLPSNKSVNVTVLPTIEGSDLVKYYKNNSQYYATFYDGSGEVLDNENVTFNINGVFYTRQTNQNGVARLNINLNSGNYILTAYNPVDGYSFSNNIKVLPTINGTNLKKIYRDNHQYWVTLRDFKGNPISYASVEFNVNGVFYTRQADKYGNARLNINLGDGKYIISAKNKLTGELASNNIVVSANSDTKLTTKNYVFKLSDDDTIEAKLTNKLNYGVSGEVIDLTIGDKKYSATTDDDGIASFYLNLAQGNYSLNFNHKANSIYGASSAKSTVETYDGVKVNLKCSDEVVIKDRVIGGNYYEVKLYNENNKAFSNQTVYMKLGSKIYSNVTDANGVAKFKIDAPDGVYSAKIFYNGTGYKFSQKIQQITLLESSQTTLFPLTSSVTEGCGEKLYVSLSASSIILSKKDVIFEINGRNYTKKTNEQGVANITINLNPGTYDIKYYYLGDGTFDSCFNSSKLVVKPRIQTKLDVISGSTFHKNSGITFDIQLVGDKVLAGKEITVKIGSKSYSQITDSNGVVHLNINDIGEGNYVAEYSFAGDKVYGPSKGAVTLSITPEIPYGYGYWLLYSNMYDVDLASLASQGTRHIFLHCYAVTAYGEDAVSSWARQANNYGIRVHLWMQIAYDGSWHGIGNKDGSYNYDLINSKVSEARYYASIPGIGGVHFDYLRFGGTAYKFPTAAESINYFVKTAVSAIKSVNPDCLVSAALMPEPDRMLYYDGQDYATLSRYLDAVLPMVYKGNYHQDTAWIQSMTKWFVDNSNGAEVWTGLQAYRSDDDVTRLSVSELSGDAQAALNAGARGVVMFRWGVTNFINFNSLKVH
ncbi:MAG: hypothetical protein IK044_03360 [Methanobrevibacter sp.]|nr:hypothetical protein [Methanobrevibacter sp.]